MYSVNPARLLLLALVIFITSCSNSRPVYLDPAKPASLRAGDLLKRMIIEEKVGQLCQFVGPAHLSESLQKYTPEQLLGSDSDALYSDQETKDIIKQLKEGKIGSFLLVKSPAEANLLQSYAAQSRLKIPVIIGTDAIHGHGLTDIDATIFPTPITLASAFDTSLVSRTARIIAKEMRATGYHWNFYPNVDVGRDPRWGRIEETFGEDPGLVALYGKLFTEGFQNGSADPMQNVAACVKHYIAGSEPYNGLNFASEDLSERELREIWLPAFQSSIDAGAMSVMAAHHALNGIPCHANTYLLKDLLQDELKFKGFVVSDWKDMERLHNLHFVAESYPEASIISFNSGVDMHMHGPGFFEHIIDGYNSGKVSIRDIDAAVLKILEVKFKLGLFENSYVDTEGISQHVLTDEHKAVALESARKGIVLLKNESETLPLRVGAEKVFLTGPAANSPMILGDWVQIYNNNKLETIYEALEKRLGTDRLIYAESGDIWNVTEKSISECVNNARKADIIVIAAGENSYRGWKVKRSCGENADRADLLLPGNQEQLIKELALLGKPVILLLVSGRPLVLDNILPSCKAVLNCWTPGMMGAQAISDILFGEFNPQGRLPVTFPVSLGSPVNYYNKKSASGYRIYVDSKSQSKFPFGFGLSYTSFSYDSMIIDEAFAYGKDITLEILVTNTGKTEGTENALLFINDVYSSVTVPVKRLISFQPLTLKPGEQKKLSFTIPFEELSLLDVNLNKVVEPGRFKLIIHNGDFTSGIERVFEVLK
jgi:beta-glucosidase